MRQALPLLSCVVFALAGCRSVSPPTLEVVGAAHREGVLLVDVRATNPNRQTLPLEVVHYEVWLDGARVFQGVRSPQVTLPGFGTQTLTLPASLASGHPAAGTFRIAGDLEYAPATSWRQTLRDAGMGRPSVSFTGEGRVGP